MSAAEEQRERLARAIIERDRLILRDHGPGHVELERCPLCGYMRFACCQTTAPDAVTMKEMFSITECPRCTEVHARAPEVFQWVLGVAQHLRLCLYDEKANVP